MYVRRTTILYAFAILLCAFPLCTLAESEELRAQIRADLMQDPRAKEMSPADFEALISALAARAEEEGSAATYLEGQNSFNYATLFPTREEKSTLGSLLSAPLFLALLLLLLMLAAVVLYVIRTRGAGGAASSIEM